PLTPPTPPTPPVPPTPPQGGSTGPLAAAHDGATESVGLLCRRAVRTFRWTVEAHRLQAHPDGTVTWSDPLTLSGVDGSDADRSGGNMPVALAHGPDGRVYGAWQRHDRARTAPGFHFTPGASEIEVKPLPAAALPVAASGSVAVGPPGVAPPLLRRRPAPRGVEIEGQRFRLVFGNLHRHAECSSCGRDANGPAELHMRHAPDVNRNEFLAVTDHGEHLNPGEWREQCLLADFYTWDGHRVALPGIEWTSEAPWHPPAHGHKNLILSRSDLPFVDCWMPHAEHPRRLWSWLAEHDPQAVTIPHHTMRGKAPTLWEHDDRRFQPVVEIFQDSRGSAEWLGAPAATSAERVQGLPLDPRGSVRRALDRGLRLGFIASSDHGGVALGGLYVRELSRAGVLEALRARRCFATSGDRLLLDFRVDGVFQGGELTLTERPGGRENQARPLTVTLRAEVLRPVQRVVLVRDGEELASVVPDPAARLVQHAWETEGPFVGTSYFYVRLEGADGELAWSSPVWVTRDWGES
ncbi:MAG TPA: hypothetical protein VH257_23275, partial [Chloroflexota bacterium]|nr:hypothetical protein [Chloroflexota bacterium]